MLEYLGAYFDYIAANPRFPRVVQAEWMRSGGEAAARMQRIAKEYFRPIFEKLVEVLREGIDGGRISGGESDGFSAVDGGGDCFLFQRGAADEDADEGGSVVGGADPGAAGVCAGFYFGGAVCKHRDDARESQRETLLVLVTTRIQQSRLDHLEG